LHCAEIGHDLYHEAEEKNHGQHLMEQFMLVVMRQYKIKLMESNYKRSNAKLSNDKINYFIYIVIFILLYYFYIAK